MRHQATSFLGTKQNRRKRPTESEESRTKKGLAIKAKTTCTKRRKERYRTTHGKTYQEEVDNNPRKELRIPSGARNVTKHDLCKWEADNLRTTKVPRRWETTDVPRFGG